MIDPRQLHELVIRPSLGVIELGGLVAEVLSLGTAIQESALIWLAQPSGPARGLWQIEPATATDCWANFLAFRSDLATRVRSLMTGQDPLDQLYGNLDYGCALARIKYFRDPAPLPELDVAAMSAYYKRVYNTAAGAATLEEVALSFRRAFDVLGLK